MHQKTFVGGAPPGPTEGAQSAPPDFSLDPGKGAETEEERSRCNWYKSSPLTLRRSWRFATASLSQIHFWTTQLCCLCHKTVELFAIVTFCSRLKTHLLVWLMGANSWLL